MKAELTHDILAARIYARASAEQLAHRKAQQFLDERFAFFLQTEGLLKKRDLDYLDPFLDQLEVDDQRQAFIDKSRKAAAGLFRKQLIGIGIGTIFALLAVFSTWQYFRANRKGKQAQNERKILLVQTDSLKTVSKILNQETVLANLKQDTANVQLQATRQQKGIADSLALLASNAALKAAQLRDEAENNLVLAEAAKEQASQDSVRNQGFHLASRSQQAWREGNFRLAFHFAQQSWQQFQDSLTRSPLLRLANSPYQMSTTHSAAARLVVAGPKGNIFATAYDDKTLHITNNNGESISWLNLPSPLIQMEFPPREEHLITLSEDNRIRIWNLSGELRNTFSKTQGRFLLVDDNSFLCTVDQNTVAHISMAGDTLTVFNADGVDDIISGAKSSGFLSVSKSGEIKVWDMRGEELNRFRFSGRKPVSYDISPQGRHLLAIFSSKTTYSSTFKTRNEAELWDVFKGKRIRKFQLNNQKKLLSVHFPETYADSSFWRFDMDRDGVMQEEDREPHSPLGAKVDSWGLALDTDQDGTIDLFDKSPEDTFSPDLSQSSSSFRYPTFSTFTYPHFAYVVKRNARYLEDLGGLYVPQREIAYDDDVDYESSEVPVLYDYAEPLDLAYSEASVSQDFYQHRSSLRPVHRKFTDPYGIPLDNDRDGAPNFRDMEYNSPVGAPVDQEGIAVNSDDDHLIDFFDQEVHSTVDILDNEGKARDTDRDGVIDVNDQEELTPLSAPVDQFGVATDWKPLGKAFEVPEDMSRRDSLIDADGDGIKNNKDQEIFTPWGARVDENGVAVDTDGDGRPDLIDFEIHTPKDRKTDGFGRSVGIRGEWPLHGPAPPPPGISSSDYDDDDDDGVPNIFDREAETPLGSHVNQEGVSMDLDRDGVIDLRDLEKTTPRGAPINERGVALDMDDDGVIDLFDREPATPKGIWVDRNGVSVDVDADGVPFTLDKDPYTPAGAPIDADGVALDTDQDGVIDLVDIEPLTPKGEKVDKFGQRVNRDKDGVAFERDADADGDGRFDSDIIVIVYEDEVGLWRNTSHIQVERFPHPREEILKTLVAPNGEKIMTYTRHGILRAWESVQGLGEELALDEELYHWAMSPSGDKQYIAFEDGSVRIYYPSQAPSDPDDIIMYYRQYLAPLTREEAEQLGI